MEVASHFHQKYSREHKRSKELSARTTYKQGTMANTTNQYPTCSRQPLEQAPQGSGRGPRSAVVEKRLGHALQYKA